MPRVMSPWLDPAAKNRNRRFQSIAVEQYADYEKAWMHEIQPKLARLSTCGRQLIVATSGHEIPDDAPDTVVAAVREVVGQVRGTVRGRLAVHRA